MGTLEHGSYQAINNCLKLKDTETITIITDVETLEIAVSMLQEAKKLTSKIHFFIAEDFGERPLKKVPDEIKNAITESDVGILAMQSKDCELENFRRPLLKNINGSKTRFANMVNLNRDMMEQGMDADYKEIQKFSQKVYDSVHQSIQIQVKTEKGTDFIAELSSNISWVIGDGIIKSGEWSNLPDGEVYTCPVNVNGKVIIDGIMGEQFAKMFGVLEKNPLILELKNSKVISSSCSNPKLLEEFRIRIKADDNASKVGELGLGTNKYVNTLIGRMLQDEKIPGVHIAFGNGYPEKTGSEQHSKIHLDCVILKPTIFADGKKIMENGEWLV